MISLLIGGLQEAPFVSTLHDSIVGGRCSTYFRLVWDPLITLGFILVQVVDHRVVMEFLEDRKSLGREDCNVPIFGFPYSAVVYDPMGLCHPDQRGNVRLTVS
jgi:hypothetical protein